MKTSRYGYHSNGSSGYDNTDNNFASDNNKISYKTETSCGIVLMIFIHRACDDISSSYVNVVNEISDQ